MRTGMVIGLCLLVLSGCSEAPPRDDAGEPSGTCVEIYDCILEECDPILGDSAVYEHVERCARLACDGGDPSFSNAVQAAVECSKESSGCEATMMACFDE